MLGDSSDCRIWVCSSTKSTLADADPYKRFYLGLFKRQQPKDAIGNRPSNEKKVPRHENAPSPDLTLPEKDRFVIGDEITAHDLIDDGEENRGGTGTSVEIHEPEARQGLFTSRRTGTW
jgi:hypothetical protein